MSLQPLSRTYSLSRRFTISLVLMAALIALGATVAFYVDANRQTENELLARADDLIAHLAGVAAIPIWDLNIESVTAIGDTLARDAMVAGIIITDRFGYILYSYHNSQYSTWLERTHQIQHKGEIIGDARVMFTKQRGQKAQRELLHALSITTAAMLLALTFATGALTRIFLRHPLQRLNAIVNAYAAGTYNMEDVFLPYLEFQPFAHVLQRMGTIISEQMTRLQENEARYRKAQAMGHVGNWEYHLQTTHFWGSDEAKRMYGFDPAQGDFSTDAVERCIPERTRVHQALLDLIENEKPYHLEFEIHPNDSSPPRIIASIAELQRDEHGIPLKVVGVIQDVTERKQAEEALRQRNEELKTVLDAIPALIWIGTDPECRVITGNRYVNELFGVRDGENVSQTAAQIGQALTIKHLKADGTEYQAEELPMQQCIARAQAIYNQEFTYLLPDGRRIAAIGNAVPLFDEHGRVRGAAGAFLDITDRKQVEQQAIQAKEQAIMLAERLNDAQQIAHVGCWDWDLRTNTVWWSDETYRIFGVTPEEYKPSFEGNAQFIYPDDLPKYGQLFARSLKTGESLEYDFRLVMKNGMIKHCYSQGKVRYDDTHTPILFIGTVLDITERKRAEEALRESEERFRFVLNNSLDAAYRRNLQTDRYDYMSPVIEHVLGWSVAEMNEMSTDTVLRLVHPDDVPGIAQEIERTTTECRTTGRATGMLEYRIRDHQGVYRWVGDTITVLADANSLPLYRLGMVRDITERKLSEEKLLQYQRIVSSTPDGIALLDRRYRYIIVNDSYERFSGVSRDTFIGKTVAEYLGEEVFQRQVKTYFDRCLQGETIRYRSWFDYPTLGQRFVEVTYSPYCNPRQEIIGIVSNTRDITENKQAEDALRESEARLKIAIRHSSFVFAFCDRELRYTWIHNPHSDFKPEEVIGKRDDELAENEGMTRLVRFKQRVIDTGCGAREEISFPLGEGNLTYDMIAEPLRDDAGHVIGVATAALDITERKQAEVQIREHNRLLEEAVQQKQREMEALFERMLRQEKLATIGQITGSIAHELRNPLGAVKQAIYYLKKLAQRQQLTTDNPKVLRHLDIMETELNTSERVIADLLEITRMKHPKRQPTDMRTLLTDAVARCHLPPNVRVTISLTPDPIEISVDPLQLRQVFINVLTNAAQAIEGNGAISIDAAQLPESGETIIKIVDTGVGLTAEALQKVFEPLYTTKATGTGLGLPICKEIIEAHHGAIGVTSLVGKGTSVTITFPRHECRAEEQLA